ncbi:1-(5-phosphoribosyl)-5-[(5-phosphoribosylamino)methylideneamino]imidazole-4-carboxamide isomerase [Myroides sp. LJL119]
MRIIPAIDIIDAKCVCLVQGDYQKMTVYQNDPVDLAKSFVDAGIKYLHLVDLQGAKSRGVVNWKTLERIATQTNLKIDFSGGINTQKDIEIALECGASQVSVGSVAQQKPTLFLHWLALYGAHCIVLSADAKNKLIQTCGWLHTTQTDVLDFIKGYTENGLQTAIVTDISKDGMLQGPCLELYQEILQEMDINLIASAGVRSIEDLTDLKNIGCFGAIIGTAIYKGEITLKQLEKLW